MPRHERRPGGPACTKVSWANSSASASSPRVSRRSCRKPDWCSATTASKASSSRLTRGSRSGDRATTTPAQTSPARPGGAASLPDFQADGVAASRRWARSSHRPRHWARPMHHQHGPDAHQPLHPHQVNIRPQADAGADQRDRAHQRRAGLAARPADRAVPAAPVGPALSQLAHRLVQALRCACGESSTTNTIRCGQQDRDDPVTIPATETIECIRAAASMGLLGQQGWTRCWMRRVPALDVGIEKSDVRPRASPQCSPRDRGALSRKRRAALVS